MNPTKTNAWRELTSLSQSLPPIAELLQANPTEMLQFNVGGCLFDFSKQRVNPAVLAQFNNLADEMQLGQKIQDMVSGQPINTSEGRAVLHTALRGGAQAGDEIEQQVAAAQQQMLDLCQQIISGAWKGYTNKAITDVVHIGIGGSHLGPELIVDALRHHHDNHLRFHFAANIDAGALYECLAGLNPETTLFIVASKSFSTLETKVNALTARSWFVERTAAVEQLSKHFVGITTNEKAAVEFGLDANNLLPMWDWVGGRFSLWSAVGLPIMMALGESGFKALLSGACEVDQHLAVSSSEQPFTQNVPAMSALLSTWNYNFLGASSLAMLSYDERLNLLPDYLQQLEMESNGKSVTLDNTQVDYHTMPVLWGGVGTNGQHAYHQLLHQGTRSYCADFIICAQDDYNNPEHHQQLNANALAQSQAMAIGFKAADHEPWRNVPGNHPSTTIVLDELAPRQMGALLAVYEHKVFCQGVLWNINSFDQWGVELGKKLAIPIYDELAEQQTAEGLDASTASLISYLKANR